ncbi:4756_t:CDS:2 [Funneliformis mosseae]|uniref:4756_t:CDS:1 n=1 Tax=Funneliformis mosseae TaxID=27381 RepID=A0A9N9DGB3_FUNMO|nr:4756_t:CDS:2 [Funneliformis mosseae]
MIPNTPAYNSAYYHEQNILSIPGNTYGQQMLPISQNNYNIYNQNNHEQNIGKYYKLRSSYG